MNRVAESGVEHVVSLSLKDGLQAESVQDNRPLPPYIQILFCYRGLTTVGSSDRENSKDIFLLSSLRKAAYRCDPYVYFCRFGK